MPRYRAPAAEQPAGSRRRRRGRRLLLRLAVVVVAAQGAVTSRYFVRTRPEASFPLALEIHKGIDFGAPRGSAVRAAKSGFVADVRVNPTLGRYIVIRHWLGFSTLYAHLDATHVRAGRLVLKWARIGTVGQSGRATGPHLHFEVHWHGRPLPPGPLLAIDSARSALWRLMRSAL